MRRLRGINEARLEIKAVQQYDDRGLSPDRLLVRASSLINRQGLLLCRVKNIRL
jgi:hypothetical protein